MRTNYDVGLGMYHRVTLYLSQFFCYTDYFYYIDSVMLTLGTGCIILQDCSLGKT